MEKPWILLGALFFALPVVAGADSSTGAPTKKRLPPMVCESAASVKARTRSCRKNAAFIKAAEECLDRLTAIENAASANAQGEFSKRASGEQSAQISSTARGYASSSEALGILLALAGIAKADLAAYPNKVTVPDGFLDPAQTRGNPLEWAKRNDCFGKTQARLQTLRDRLEQKIAGYRTAQEQSRKNARSASGKTTSMDSLSGAAGKAGKPEGPLPRAQPRTGPSDVTGLPPAGEPSK